MWKDWRGGALWSLFTRSRNYLFKFYFYKKEVVGVSNVYLPSGESPWEELELRNKQIVVSWEKSGVIKIIEGIRLYAYPQHLLPLERQNFLSYFSPLSPDKNKVVSEFCGEAEIPYLGDQLSGKNITEINLHGETQTKAKVAITPVTGITNFILSSLPTLELVSPTNQATHLMISLILPHIRPTSLR